MRATLRRGWFVSVTVALILSTWTLAAVDLPVEAALTSDGEIPQTAPRAAGLTAGALATDAAAGALATDAAAVAPAQPTPQRCGHCGRELAPVPQPAWQPLTDTGLARGAASPAHAGSPPQGPDGARAAVTPGDGTRPAAPVVATSGCDLSTGTPACLLGAMAGPRAVPPDAGSGKACACEGCGAGKVGGATGPVSHALTAGRPGDTLGLWRTWRFYVSDGKNDRAALVEHARGAMRPLEALAALSAAAGSLVRLRSGAAALRTLAQRAPMLRPCHAPRRCPACAALAALMGDAWRTPDQESTPPARRRARLVY